MKFEMTERDKRLLIGLAMFVVVVCVGYWGILPQLTRIDEINEELEVAIDERDEKELKVMELPMLEIENKELEEGILESKSQFFQMMDSDEVDKMMTTMVLGYNLYAYDLSISMPKGEAKLAPYINSKSKDPSSYVNSGVQTGVYCVGISMRLGGTYEDFERIIYDLSKTEQKIKLNSFSYGTTSRIVENEDGGLEYQEEMVLNLSLELYMCEE